MEAPIDTVKDAVTARTLLVHLKENRIEYLLVIVVGHLLGVSDRILAQASGICFQNLYTNLYVYKSLSSDMARLYWRVKKNGKWTWTPATLENTKGIEDYDPKYAYYQGESE